MTTRSSDPELRAALERLFALQTFGVKLGTGPITRLLDELGNPQRRFPAVHVAGTNGKGSACAMIASTLMEAGLRVGLYVSPHLVEFEERIRVDGRMIDLDRLARYAREMLPMIERAECTFFEGTTAIACRYFAEEEVDVAVVETGMGGRLDATNVVAPVASAITSIGLDHTRHLGDTLEQIAFEKAGIMKSGVPAVVGSVRSHLREVFDTRAREIATTVEYVDDVVRATMRGMDFDGVEADFVVRGRRIDGLRIGLVGEHQIANAGTAIALLDLLRERFGVDDAAIRRGLEHVVANTGISGRFQSVSARPRSILDVAHNPDGMAVVAQTLQRLLVRPKVVHLVYGAVSDKDIGGVLRTIAPLAVRLHAVRAEHHRSLAAEEIQRLGREAGISSHLAGSVADGLTAARGEAGDDEVILVCGSFFVVGEAIEFLQQSAAAISSSVRDASIRPAHLVAPVDTFTPTDQPAERWTTTDTASASRRRTTVKEWIATEQPRERLMRQGAPALSNAELLAILLRTGTRRHDVLEVGRNLLQRYDGSMVDLASRDYRELQSVDGIGPAKAVTLAAAFELACRVRFDPFASRPKIESPEDVASIFVPKLRGIRKEQFHVLILNSASQVIRTELVSEGNLNSSIVHPREVFRTAIVERAAAIIGLHNHPSGNPTPSREDIAVTRQLVEAGRILGITFHDHIIIAGEEHVSMAERGYV